jgi:hypothetical protein
MTHYWPIENGQMNDKIGSANMIQGNATSFTTDRFGNANSALALNCGWTQIPQGIYFDTLEFSISVWIYPSNIGIWSRIIDFGNGEGVDNIFLSFDSSLDSSLNQKPAFLIKSSGTEHWLRSSQALALNQWQNLIATFDGTQTRIYLNGLLKDSAAASVSTNSIVRSLCYIGKSNWAADGYSESYLDDLIFFNRSFVQSEIMELTEGFSKWLLFNYLLI